MPGYELSLILKVLHGPELKEAVKRSVSFILENGGIVRKLEYLGEKRLPYRIKNHNQSFVEGRYFIVDFHGPTSILPLMSNYYKRDIDIIRQSIIRQETESLDRYSALCEGVYDDKYQPSKKNIMPAVRDQLKNIKL